MFDDALILTGATGSGKSAAALRLALELGGEIVALDSMTLFRGMDIGTAKPTRAEREQVPHHLIDVLAPHEAANVAWWLGEAVRACADIRARGKRPIFVGGTPLYLKALRHGLFDAPPADLALRARLEALPSEELFARLREADPAAAERLHPNDQRRVVRALEVFEQTGKPLSDQQQSWNAPPTEIPTAVLQWPRAELHARINARAQAMFDAGWLAEARDLRARPLGREALQAVGYAELFALLDGHATTEATLERIRARTRQFAKRQETWFRSLPGLVFVPGDARDVSSLVRAAWRV